MQKSQFSNPMLVSTAEPMSTQSLGRVHLGGDTFDEQWLQELLHRNPGCLPIDEIEPAFEQLFPICTELRTKHGFVDNLFMTPAGDIVLAEVKLWRNAEMRRKVIAQALDYASCLFEMDYEELERAVRDARTQGRGVDAGDQGPLRLHELVGPTALEEARFADAVSNNLARGRAIILVVGDGIRTETKQLLSLLEAHGGLHFTFALVELAVFKFPTDETRFIVCPRTLAQTEMITRAIVELRGDGLVAKSPATQSGSNGSLSTHGAPHQPRNISAEQFWDSLSKQDALLPEKVQAFLISIEDLGVTAEFRRTLILRLTSPSGSTAQLGYIQPDGLVWTADVHGMLPSNIATAYITEMAKNLGMSVGTVASSGRTYVTESDGGLLKLTSVADRFVGWRDAIESLVERLAREQQASQ